MSRWAIIIVLALCGPVSAAEVSIGPFCLSGVEEKADPTDLSFSDGSQWMRVRHRYNAPPSGSKANLVIFARPVPQDDPNAPPDCAAIRSVASRKGVPILLDGLVEELDLVSRVGLGQPGNRLWVDPDGKIDITLRRVTSGLQPVGGGVLDLKGSWLWIRGIGQLLSTPEKISGTLEIEAYDRTIVNSKISFPGGASAVATLRQPAPDAENLTIRLDTETGVATLWRGTMAAGNVLAHGGSLELPSITLVDANVLGSLMILTARAGALSGEFRRLRGTASSLATRDMGATFQGASITINKGNLQGTVGQGKATFDWGELSATDLVIQSTSAELLSRNNLVVKGPASAQIARLSVNEVQATVNWTVPRITGLPLYIPDDKAKSLQLVLSGPSVDPLMSGKLIASAFGFAGLSVQRELSLAFGVTGTGTTISLPVDVNLPGLGGDLSLSDYDQKVLLKAGIDGFKLKATLDLDPVDLVKGSSLRISPNGLLTGLSAAASLQPWLAGTKPGLAKVGVSLSNKDEVVVGNNTSGALLLDSSLLTLAEPVMRIGEEGIQRRASLKLNTVGSASFTYPLADRRLVLQKARFEVKDLEFSFLDPGGTLDLGGTIVDSPLVRAQSMVINLDRAVNAGTMAAENLNLSGSRFSRTRTAKTETAFSGKQKRAFTIGSLSAVPEFNDNSITVRQIGLNKLDFALDDASLTLGDALLLRKATVSLSADRIRSVDEVQKNEDGSDQKDDKGNLVRKRREYFTNLRVEASGQLKESEYSDAMQLDVPPAVGGLQLTANGRSDMLDGAGQFNLSPFSGLFRDKVEFQFACKDGRHPTSPSETRFSTGGSAGALGVKVEKGKFLVEGALLALNLLYKSDTSVECDSSSQKHVISPEKELWTWGICPTWEEPFRKCKWSTNIPEVSFSYHLRFGFYGLAGQATIAVPLFMTKDGETKFCFVPPVSFNPLIAMGISPQVEVSNGTPGDVEKILNGLIHTALVPIESAFVTGLGNAAALAVGSVASTPEGATLACALLRKDIFK
jgi:hypothetical protein